MIKITKPRAAISTDFSAAMKQISTDFVRDVKRQIDFQPNAREYILGREKVKLARHVALLNDPAAFDMELTRLRNLPYSDFSVVTVPAHQDSDTWPSHHPYRETVYLVGVTRPIVCDGRKEGRFDIGPYRVCLPLSRVCAVGGMNELHFIPLRDERAGSRFFHHTARPHSKLMPEQFPASTCWGSFSNVPSIVGDKFVFEIFRVLYDYLTRYDAHSRYTGSVPGMVRL
jgi:hypothetical protein